MYDYLIFGAVYLVAFGLMMGARWLDKKAGNEGLIMTKSVSVTTVCNGWSKD